LSALKKGKNCKKQSVGLVIAAAIITSLLVAGTILAPIQLYAIRSSGGIPDTSSLKHGIRDGVNVNLEHRDQHMDQENLCYRANTCRQSNVGQNTLGNDNSVTGFADQSDNIPQAASSTPVTPGNQTGNQTGGGGGGGGGGGTQACPNGLVRVTLNASGISACVSLAGSAPPNPQTGLCTLPLVAARVDGIILCVSLVGSV
jgi:hypothetical protein